MEEMSEIWQHKKTRGLYIIKAFARLESDPDKTMVVYMSLGNGVFWARPQSEFYDGRMRQLTKREVDIL